MKTQTKPMRTTPREFILCLNCDHTFDGDTGEKITELPDDAPGVVRGCGCCRECLTPLAQQKASLFPALMVASSLIIIGIAGLAVMAWVNL